MKFASFIFFGKNLWVTIMSAKCIYDLGFVARKLSNISNLAGIMFPHLFFILLETGSSVTGNVLLSATLESTLKLALNCYR